ncbi:MAG: glycosyltransferase family 4 protein [Nanoarchaeota archaeon]|nr:glycosyltransferase family 4 protein [Nanoarchaeota archaeon]
MNILIENPNFYPLLGGVETYMDNVSQEFMKKGHKVTILCSNPDNKEKKVEYYKKIKIVRYETPVLRKGLVWSWPLAHQKIIGEKLKEMLEKEKYDLVITRSVIFIKPNLKFFDKEKIFYIPPCVMKEFFGKMLKHIPMKIFMKYYLNSKLLSKMEKNGVKKVQYVLPLSKMVKNRIIKRYKVSEKNVKVVNPGIDYKKFKTVDLKNNNVISVGRLSSEKNVISLIEAFKYVKNGNLIIVGGGGDYEKKLRDLTLMYKLENKIKFVGWQKNPEKFLKESSVFVLPSKYESFGHVFLEAMASGIPCVAFKPDGKKIITAADEIIKEGKTGFLVKDEKEMAEKIDLLLGDEELRKKMGKAGRKEVEKYSWEKTAKEILKFAEK